MIADDLFAGAGGWDIAAARLGVHARGVEVMPEARATRVAAGLETIHDDVWTFTPDRRAEGLIASPPCQTFSTAGSGSGRKALDDVLFAIKEGIYRRKKLLQVYGSVLGDQRTALVLAPLHYATQYDNYRWLAWEQVPTVLPVWEACAEVLREEGWSVWTGNLNAEQYGVPQTRKRAFLLASRDAEVTPPTPTHSRYYSRTPDKLDPDVAKWVSMAEALGWSSDVEETMPDGTMRFAQQSDNVPDYAWPHNRPATVVAGRDLVQAPGATSNRFNGSTKSRNDGVRVSVSEAALLQSFPADFPWQGTKSKQSLQCGNAVPPLLAQAALSSSLGQEYVFREAEGVLNSVEGLVDLCGSPSGVTGPCHRSVEHPAATVTGVGNYYIHSSDQCHQKLK